MKQGLITHTKKPHVQNTVQDHLCGTKTGYFILFSYPVEMSSYYYYYYIPCFVVKVGQKRAPLIVIAASTPSRPHMLREVTTNIPPFWSY